ncbi:MAG TPA: hypothetical protein VK436_08850 [Methanocella sp.]|nr:hypothetical protein [Methanocella sp.]
MSVPIETGLVITLIILLLAVDFIVWLTGTVFLLGLLGWHPPGWMASPVTHAMNTGLAIAGGVVAVALPVLLDLAIKHIT